MSVDAAGDQAEFSRRVAARIEHLTTTRSWPWMQPGQISVGLDDDGRLQRYLATDTDLIPIDGHVTR